MELYKANLDGVINRETKDPNVKSGVEVSRIIKKGELILVKKTESLIDKFLSFPYKKYSLWNGNFAISVLPPDTEQEAYVRADFSDVPEHLFVQIKKPKVYITLSILLLGLATYSIIKERKNN